MPASVKEDVLTLSDLKNGQVWMIDEPGRIARIGKKTKVETIVITQKDRRLETRDAVEVTATIPAKPIDGFVSARQAGDNVELLGTLVENLAYDQPDERAWTEIWSERIVPNLLKNKKSGALYRDTDFGPYHKELYCHEVKGRGRRTEGLPGTRAGSSRIAGKKVWGKLVPKEAVPAGLFEFEAVA